MEEIALIRPAKSEDVDALLSFAEDVGYGFTSLPKERSLIAAKIEHSERSFATPLHKPKNELYLFILEIGGRTVGCSAIVSCIGMEEPFFAYHLRKEQQDCRELKVNRTIPVLHLIEATKKPTELCTLFIKEEYRKQEWGKLLSFSRLLFIAAKRTRFVSRVIAELRGLTDKNGRSPFWEAVGKPFYNLSFERSLFLRYTHPEIVRELFPKHPIYPWLLPAEASNAIGEIHPDTIPARKMLEKQGFRLSSYYDIFDAGPHLYAETDDILGVRMSRESIVSEIHDGKLPISAKALISNTQLDFRATMTFLTLDENNHVILSKKMADALRLREGDKVRILDIL